MNKRTKALCAAAVALGVPLTSHVYLEAERAAVDAYRKARARASVWLLEKLQRPYDLRLLVETEAIAQGLRPELALAVVEQESGWNPAAVRSEPALKTASFGLFQILPATGKACPGSPSASELLHPVANVRCGVFLLRRYVERGKSARRALVAYNGGEACLSRSCPAAEQYAAQVLDRL